MSERSEEIGERLAQVLLNSITFESNKKRARLDREADRAYISPLRVIQDVHAAVKIARTISLTPRPTVQLKRFKELLGALDEDLPVGVIEPWAWPWLGVSEEHDIHVLSANRLELVSRLETAIETLMEGDEYKLDRRGGRHTDPGFDRFLQHLAFIYRQYTGYRPTYSEDINGLGQRSPFFQFAAEVLRSFADEEPIGFWATRNGALQTAVKCISGFERGSHEYDPGAPLLHNSVMEAR